MEMILEKLFIFIRIWLVFVFSLTAGNDTGKFLTVSNIMGKFVGHSWKLSGKVAVIQWANTLEMLGNSF